MDWRKKFISIWNEIKKFPGFFGKTIAVDQLNDATVFPWFLNFSKNFSADYRKCKSNRWDYLVSIHDFQKLNTLYPSNLEKRKYLIEKYNERLLFYSNDKLNAWVIDDRDENCLVVHKKEYLEFEKRLAFLIEAELEKKITRKALAEKELSLERKRITSLAQLALLKTCKEETCDAFIFSSPINYADYQAAIDEFNQLITQEVNSAFIKNEIKKIKRQQQKIAKELYVHFVKKTETIRIYSIKSNWEKINQFVLKNKPMKFFLFLWCGFSSHASLLNLISFLLLFFCLSLYSYPIIFFMLGISLASYLIFRIFYLVKNDFVIFPNIVTDEVNQILELIKIDVFNEEKNKNDFKLIHEIVYDLSRKNLNLNEFIKSILNIQKNFDPIYLTSINIHESKLYQYLTEVYPKTQFLASLTINLTSVLLYTYLLTWAIQSFLLFFGALSLATFIVSPVVVGVLILIVTTFFLISHLCKFCAREDFYRRTILNKLNEMCEYHYKDEYGGQQVVQVEKWKKFEYLESNFHFLELVYTSFFEVNKLDSLNKKFYSVFNNCRLNKAVYSCCDHAKVSGGSSPGFKKFKKFLNRSFAFFGGGFYGYNIGQQIVWKSNLGLHMAIKMWTLPIFFIFLPLIIINGIANFLTYHLHSRQQRRFKMLNNLDSRIELLERINKNLLFLTTLWSIEQQHLSSLDTNLLVNREKQSVSLSNNNLFFIKRSNKFSFFKETYPPDSALEKLDKLSC